MDANPTFEQSLKLINLARFDLLDGLICSRLPDGHVLSADQVIGFWYLDKKKHQAGTPPFFKQDIVVNVGAASATFLSFAAKGVVAQCSSPHVRLIADFYRDYSDGGLYYWRHGVKSPWVHHFDDVSHLPPELQPSGEAKKRAFLGK